ncbi:MAG: hypothetical protein ABW318_21285 [Vicinamibacterales bacterium]
MTALGDFILSVKEWVDDADPSDVLVTQWVRLGETRMNNELRTDVQVVRQYATFDDNCAVLPDDWLKTVYVRPQGGRPLNFVSNDTYWKMTPQTPPYMEASPSSDPPYPYGKMGYYTHVGRTVFIWPPINPNDLTKIEVAYYAMVPPLAQDATPVFVRYPDIYLNCTLAAAQPYLVEDDRLNTFAALATAGIKMANDASMLGRFSGSPMLPAIRGFG